jgi:hypothetical protein
MEGTRYILPGKIALLALAACLILACAVSRAWPGPAETATPQPSATPSPTVSPPTPTPTVPSPTATLTLEPSPASMGLPAQVTGTPVAVWRGVPVMPGALTGEKDDRGYRFTTRSSREEIMHYYDQQMKALGWKSLVEGQGDNGNLLLIFQKGEATFTIAILSMNGGIQQVMLVD